MAKLNPYLHLDGTTREAMEFYKSILGGELEFMTMGESGMPEIPEDKKDNIMHSSLKTSGWTLMASDMFDPTSFKIGDNVDICLVCESKEEFDSIFSKLSEGGKVFMEPEETSFGWFTSFTDKFGVEWMLQYFPEKA